jgi:hypothetical protein
MITLLLKSTSIIQYPLRTQESQIGNMVVRQPRYSKEEFAQRGDRWYETQIREKVESQEDGEEGQYCGQAAAYTLPHQ